MALCRTWCDTSVKVEITDFESGHGSRFPQTKRFQNFQIVQRFSVQRTAVEAIYVAIMHKPVQVYDRKSSIHQLYTHNNNNNII